MGDDWWLPRITSKLHGKSTHWIKQQQGMKGRSVAEFIQIISKVIRIANSMVKTAENPISMLGTNKIEGNCRGLVSQGEHGNGDKIITWKIPKVTGRSDDMRLPKKASGIQLYKQSRKTFKTFGFASLSWRIWKRVLRSREPRVSMWSRKTNFTTRDKSSEEKVAKWTIYHTASNVDTTIYAHEYERQLNAIRRVFIHPQQGWRATNQWGDIYQMLSWKLALG